MFLCIIQARMNSTRLRGKVMKKIDGKNPSLFYTISQLQSCKLIKKIIVATTTKKEDDIIEKFSKKINIECFRGSENDVLDRYYNCAKNSNFKNIIRITADCPLIDPTLVDRMILEFKRNNYDYIHNFDPRTFPDGEDIEIFTMELLSKAWRYAKLPSEREHVTPYLRKNYKKFKIKNFANKKDLSEYRLTVDYKEDLKLIKKIIKNIDKRPILIKDIIQFLQNKPELIKINTKFEPNEGYAKSLEEDKKILKNK